MPKVDQSSTETMRSNMAKILAKDMVYGRWYHAYGMNAVCLGPMHNGKHMLVGIDGDTDLQSTEGWPLDKEVEEIEDPYKK
jgi:hypothetical protein